MQICLALILLEKQREGNSSAILVVLIRWGWSKRVVNVDLLVCCLHFLRICFYVSYVSMFPQGYAEGSHYNEHEGLSSPFISSGVASMICL